MLFGCLCSFYFGKWHLFQCLSKTWVTTDKQCFSCCELCKDTRYFVLLFCLCSFYNCKWNLFQCLSKSWVATNKKGFSFFELSRDTWYFMLFVLPIFLYFLQMEPLSMCLHGLSYHWQAVFFILWIIQGHKIFYAFCVSYVPFILANGTSFNVSPRPELPLTSSIFYFVRCFLLFVLPMLLLFRQVEPLSMSLLALSCHWQEGVFILWIIQGHKIFYAFCVSYVPFILANGTSFNVFPRPELPLTSTVFHFLNYPVANSINQEVFKVAVGWELVCNPSSTWNSAQMLIEEWGMHWFQRASFKKSF